MLEPWDISKVKTPYLDGKKRKAVLGSSSSKNNIFGKIIQHFT